MDRVTPDSGAPDDIVWAPSRAVFLRRALINGAITFGCLAVGAILLAIFAGFPVLWLLLACLMLSLGFTIEDALRWQGARFDRWKIHQGHLVHEGSNGAAQIPLSEIADVKVTFMGRVMIRLNSGQRVLIRYLRFPDAAAHQIRAASGGSLDAPQ